MSPPRATGSTGLVAAWMMGALTAFVIAALALRTLTIELNALEIGFARTSVGLVLLLVLLCVRPALREELSRSEASRHIPRNLVHAIGGVAFTLAIAKLPFATVFSIEFTAPAWVALLAYPLLRERVSVRALIGIALCVVGVLTILRPGAASFDSNGLLALGAAFCFALSIILTRKLALTQSVFAILFWMMTWQLVFYAGGALLAGNAWRHANWPAEVLLAIPLLGLSGLASQLCLAKALQIGEAAKVIPLDFLRVPIIAMIGWQFYGEALSVWVFGGATLIMAGIGLGLLPPPADPSEERAGGEEAQRPSAGDRVQLSVLPNEDIRQRCVA